MALVGPQAPPAGGMARQREILMERLRASGIEVVPVAMNAPYWPPVVRRVPGLRALCRLVPYVMRLWRVCGRVDLVHVMANSGWSFHLFAAPAVWVARARGVPVVMSYHGGQAQAFFLRQWPLVKPTFERVTLIVPSGFLQAVFARFGRQVEVVPNSVDVSRFSPGARRLRAAHVVVTRNLEPVYDIGTAIRAFARLPGEAFLTIAGSGPELHALQNLAATLGVSERVRFAGRLGMEELVALYRSADVMVNPSLADNMPNSLLEAMACGVPVVSTRVGGVPWLVEDGESALLVAPGDHEAMARELLRVIDEPEVAHRLTANGLARVRAFSWEAVGPRLLETYARARGVGQR